MKRGDVQELFAEKNHNIANIMVVDPKENDLGFRGRRSKLVVGIPETRRSAIDCRAPHQ